MLCPATAGSPQFPADEKEWVQWRGRRGDDHPARSEFCGPRTRRRIALLFLVKASGQFELSADNHASFLQLCRQLHGMPLAIELAAVRTRALGVEEIVTRLKD
jgi:hypothetical protein